MPNVSKNKRGSDKLEQDDQVGQVYRKSLLYMVSRAFEEQIDPPQAILGMQKYSDDLLVESAVEDLGEKFRLIYSRGRDGDPSQSETHGGFDNDVATMNSLLQSILEGKEPEIPFTAESLDY